MSYLVLARKYRPQTFTDLVGQDHVARTLANAIASGRVAHAFLFTGVRGVGKTTSARLLAKCLNCMGPDGTATGPTSTPCQVCAPCKEITAGADIDVQEIDGASYNGVDEVRRLQEGINFRPARDRFKIYIVDEVHMLSNAAWNAFLKTLEEPPPHVKFIFATTEVHKVPVTILSRCQRYDFKLIPTATIAKRLQEVLAAESIEADGESVAVLAREAAGSMRDAMSLLDQVIAFSGTKLTGDDVARVLGVADRTILHDLAQALVAGDAAAALKVVDRLAGQGFDLAHVARDVLRHLRNLVVARVCGPDGRELLDLADEEARDVLELASRADQDDLVRLYQGFSRSFDEIVRGSHPRAALEMALVKLARRPPLLPLDELLARLGELEKRLGGAPPPAPRGGPSGTSPSGGTGSSFSGPWVPPAPARMDRAVDRGDGVERTRGALALAAKPEPPPVAEPSRPAPPVSGVTPRITPAPRLEPVPPDAALPPPPAPQAPAKQGPSTPIEDWRAILERVRATSPRLGSVLEHAIPMAVGPDRVAIGYDAQSTFLADQVDDPEAFALLKRAVAAHFGPSTEVVLDRSAQRDAGAVTVYSIDAERKKRAQAEARAAVENHPLVQEAIRLFSAELREVKLPEPTDGAAPPAAPRRE